MNETTTQCPPAPSRRVVKFLTREFDAFAEPLGYTSNVQKARLVNCGIATMSRIRAGKQNPGPRVIAAIYATARRHGVDPGKFFDFDGSDD